MEVEFMTREPHEYTNANRKYLRRQESGKGIIFARVTPRILNTIHRSKTVRQVLQKLDAEFRPRSKAAATMARKRFYSFPFKAGSNMHTYLRLFQDNADQFRDSGQELPVDEEVEQLIASLPSDYNTAVIEYRMYAADNGTSLQTLRRLLIDRYEQDGDERTLLTRYSNLQIHDNTDGSTEKKCEPESANSESITGPASRPIAALVVEFGTIESQQNGGRFHSNAAMLQMHWPWSCSRGVP